MNYEQEAIKFVKRIVVSSQKDLVSESFIQSLLSQQKQEIVEKIKTARDKSYEGGQVWSTATHGHYIDELIEEIEGKE